MSRSQILVPAALLSIAAVGAIMLAMPARADTKSFNHSGFDAVAAGGGANVVVKQGPFSIHADGGKNALDYVLVEQHGSQLTISNKPHVSWFHIDHVVVTVTAPSLKTIAASGGADLEGDALDLGNLTVTASGGADIELAGRMGDVSVTSSGGADVKMTGSCGSLTAKISSGADFSGKALKCATANVTASGGADAEAWASGAVVAKASGGADVHIHGSPTSIEKTASGGGSVKTS